MKRTILIITILFFLAEASYGEAINNPVKWSQPPAFDSGFDIYSEETFGPWIADDFQCQNGLPVTDIHWWGSYLGQAIKPDAFIIEFYTDVPAGIDQPFSHPGKSVYWQLIPFPSANETDTGRKGADGYEVYQYFVDLTSFKIFNQQKDKIYWISIRGWTQMGQLPNWGWHTSSIHWNDFAVTGDPPGVNWQPLSQDMAFEFTTVPLPSAIILLGSGLFSMMGIRRKLRR